jgi:hypothetical protein
LTSCKGEAGCSRILCVEGLNKLRLFLFSPIYTLAFASTHSFVLIIAAALGMVHAAHAFENKTHDRMYGAASPLESHKDFVNKGKFRPRKFDYSTSAKKDSKDSLSSGKASDNTSEESALRNWTAPPPPPPAVSEQMRPTETALDKDDLSDLDQTLAGAEKRRKHKKRKKHKKHKKKHGSKKTAVLPARATMTVYVTAIKGVYRGRLMNKKVEFLTTFMFGSDRKCDVRLELDDEISGVHGTVRAEEEDEGVVFYYVDSSANGSHVAKEFAEEGVECQLNPLDVIALGDETEIVMTLEPIEHHHHKILCKAADR